jgi:hypothetical protein
VLLREAELAANVGKKPSDITTFSDPNVITVSVRDGGCIVFGFCDNSMREKDWRCRKRGTQAA